MKHDALLIETAIKATECAEKIINHNQPYWNDVFDALGKLREALDAAQLANS